MSENLLERYTIEEEFVRVGDGNGLYVVQYGNPEGVPWIQNNGGPGQQLSETHADLFDPERDYAILYDQRGAGQSTSERGPLHANETQYLSYDIETLANRYFGPDRAFNMAGGSWGSFLTGYTAARLGGRIISTVTWAHATGRAEDRDDMIHGAEAIAKAPKEHARLMEYVPDELKDRPYSDIARYLLAQLIEHGEDSSIGKQIAVAFGAYQFKLAEPVNPVDEETRELYAALNAAADWRGEQLESGYEYLKSIGRDSFNEAIIALHFFANNFFVGSSYYEDTMAPGIANIQGTAYMYNGELDASCRWQHAKWAEQQVEKHAPGKATLDVVEDAGHIRTDELLKDRITDGMGQASDDYLQLAA